MRKPNIAIHMGASIWTAKVRAAHDNFVTFNLRKMDTAAAGPTTTGL
jgi:hypothetical protein